MLLLGGHLLLLVIGIGLMYRLGGFVLTQRERKGWAIGASLLIAWGVLLAFIGPLPPPIVVGMNLFAIGLLLWAWRTGRFSIEAVPADIRAEAQRRRQWMREHVRLLLAMCGAICGRQHRLRLRGALLLFR